MTLRRLRVPEEHGGILADPPLSQGATLLATNQANFRAASLTILGRSIQDLRAQASSEAITGSHAFLRKLGIEPPARARSQLIVTGHQPELFHPGVWVKNLAAQGLARSSGSLALNLIIDNDLVKSPSIRVPDLAAKPVRAIRVPFDRAVGVKPFEECDVQDESAFERFPGAVSSRLASAACRPMLPSFWEKVRRISSRTTNLGERLAGARRLQEEEWGCRNLELPLSKLCQTESFAWFAMHVLLELPRFHAVYNSCLTEYRRSHRLRSRNHPVPALASDGDWLEAPFWVWRTGDSERRRVFARGGRGQMELRLGSAGTLTLPAEPDMGKAAAHLRELGQAGVKLRTRALTTTLFARVFLADLFIHGIGGAAYDELTDAIIRKFYNIEPPRFLTLSATLRLPIGRANDCTAERNRAERELRDLDWNPDRHLPPGFEGNPAIVHDLRRKQALMAVAPQHPADRQARYREFRILNDRLREAVIPLRRQTEQDTARLTTCAEEQAVLHDREYAFCLHEEAELRSFLLPFLDPANA